MNMSEQYTGLVKATSEAVSQLVAEGATDLATIELLRTLNTGIAGILMLAEGQLNAAAALVELAVDERERNG